MFRISLEDGAGDTASMYLVGTLDHAAAAELRHACRRALGRRQRVQLDLSEVQFADEPALVLLRELQRQGIELTNLPLLIRTQLEGQP